MMDVKTMWCAFRLSDEKWAWEFIGVFDEEQLAKNACDNEKCFIAPFVVNDIAPIEPVEMPNCKFFPFDGE